MKDKPIKSNNLSTAVATTSAAVATVSNVVGLMMLLNRKPVKSRSISFAKRKNVVLICPECRKAAEYSQNSRDFPECGILDDEDYDDHLEKHDYFAISSHAMCPHCRKDFTVTGWLGLNSYETYDDKGRKTTFTQEEAVRIRRDVFGSSGFSLGNRKGCR